MTDRNLFKIAARRKTRFPSSKGALTVEQLYQLSLADIDLVARDLNSQLKELEEESFVEIKPDARKTHLRDALDLVKEVIADLLADKEAREQRAAKADLRRTLLAARARKQDEALDKATLEDIDRQLAALGEEG